MSMLQLQQTFWKRGFTAIEMMVVVSIVILLVAMVVPTIGPAIKKGNVNDAASAIQRACSMARQLARSNSEPKATGGSPVVKHYGVAVVVPSDGGSKIQPAYAVVVYGDKSLSDYSYASNANNQYPNGTPNLSSPGAFYSGERPAGMYKFNSGVLPFKDDSVSSSSLTYTLMSAGSSIGWYYQYRTGFIFTDVSNASKAVDVGVVGGSKPESFGVATIDVKYKVAIAIYKIGLLNVQDMY